MILTMDIGNTNIKIGLFDGAKLAQYWRLASKRTYTSDELGVLVTSLFHNRGVDMQQVQGIMLSSVVPTINYTVEHMCRDYFDVEPAFVAPGIKTGIDIKYENPRELGSDRICNAVATYAGYGGNSIFIDFGTATTFGVLDAGGAFLGGCICPGKNTIANMQSGIFYGYVGQVNYLIKRIRAEMGCPDAKVIATGGFAKLIADESKMITCFDGLLTLKGLLAIYNKNFGGDEE